MFFITFEDLDNLPNRVSLLVKSIHLSLLAVVLLSATLLSSLFLLVVLTQGDFLRADALMGSFILDFQQTFVILLVSMTLLFFPLSLLSFVGITFIRYSGVLKGFGPLDLPYFIHPDLDNLNTLYGIFIASILLCFIYQDLDLRRRSSRLVDFWYALQGASILQKKAKSTLLALEILEERLWNLPQLREFFKKELEEAIRFQQQHVTSEDHIGALEAGMLTQEQAYILLKQFSDHKAAPKPKQKRSRNRSGAKNTLSAS